MNAIKATWTNGQIVPRERVDWPEGSELLVEPVSSSEKIGVDESEWRGGPESIAEWIAWVDTIQPMIWAEDVPVDVGYVTPVSSQLPHEHLEGVA